MSVNTIYNPNSRAALRGRAVLDRPATPVRELPRTQPRILPPTIDIPRSAPQLRPQARPRVITRRATEAVQSAVSRASIFGGVFLLTYGLGALVGSVNVEGARRQELAASARADEAVQATGAIRDHIEALTSRESIDRWASTHGMIDSRAAGTEGKAPLGTKPVAEEPAPNNGKSIVEEQNGLVAER